MMNATVTNPTWSAVSLYKNGNGVKQVRIGGTSATGVMATVSSVIYMNGSTDYMELYGYMSGATGGDADAGQSYTWFNGSLVRAA
jgi:hypothetical protein